MVHFISFHRGVFTRGPKRGYGGKLCSYYGEYDEIMEVCSHPMRAWKRLSRPICLWPCTLWKVWFQVNGVLVPELISSLFFNYKKRGMMQNQLDQVSLGSMNHLNSCHFGASSFGGEAMRVFLSKTVGITRHVPSSTFNTQ